MNRKEIIQLAEKLGLLYPEVDYNHPQHQRLISRIERFAKEYYTLGFNDAKELYNSVEDDQA